MALLPDSAYQPGGCCGRVLIDGLGADGVTSYYTNYLKLDVIQWNTVKDEPDFDINDYGLLIFSLPQVVPHFWQLIVNGQWSPCKGPGRICLNGEYQQYISNNGLNLTAVNQMAGLFGMSVGTGTFDCCCRDDRANPVFAHHLTAGMSRLHMACTAKVSGGTRLSKTVVGSPDNDCANAVPPDRPTYEAPGGTWIAASGINGYEMVLAGDSNHLGGCTPNYRFYRNLWTVQVP